MAEVRAFTVTYAKYRSITVARDGGCYAAYVMTPVTALYGRKASEGTINWITAVAMSAFHVGAVAALFYIDAGAILAAAILWAMAGMLGIGMGYHRLLTHRGYKTPK